MLPRRVADDHRIMLHSGRLFDLANPESSEITVEDIAHGLAHTCRYAGQCDGFFSVAEHSVLVSQIAPHSLLAALFHDAAEAYVGDMSRPLKSLLPEYKAIEERIGRAIFVRLGIEWPVPPAVKSADYSVMAAEQEMLMPAGTNEWLRDANVLPARVKIQRLAPGDAKVLFLERFEELRTAE
jgi:5'-deoxynucleotidase YfbR-like HD superfamily hydrolase